MTRRDALKLTALAAVGATLSSARAQPAASTAPASPDQRTRGLKLGIASYSLRSLQIDPMIEAVKLLDVRYLSPHRAHMPWDGTVDECRTFGQKLRDAGLVPAASGVINLPNNEAAVRKAFENAHAAGLLVMTCKPDLDSFPLVERFVKEFDLKLAIHNHGPEDKVYPTPHDAWKAIQPYDKRIGLCIDVGHTARAGTDPAEAIRQCADRVYDIHLKDSLALPGVMRDVPIEAGRGRLDLKAILSALLEIDYQHVIGYEYERTGVNPITGLAESLGYVRGLLAAMP